VKVLIPILRTHSGNDVYFRELQTALSRSSAAVEIRRFSPYLELLPSAARAALHWRGEYGNCALVHTNADYGASFKLAGRPYVVTAHHDVFDACYQEYTRVAQKTYHYGLLKHRIAQALAVADRVIAVSCSTKRSLECTFGASNVDVIYNGIDTAAFKPKRVAIPEEFANKTRLLFVGNLSKRKGADLLPQIVKRIGERYVLFYTGGSHPGQLADLANAISLGKVSREKLPAVYSMCDIFLFPSRLEGFGYAVAEAMACGKPVVCTNGSSLPELVVDQKGGYLCKQDDVGDFAERIRSLAADSRLRETMGEFNRKRILENFTLDQMAESYLRLYRGVVCSDPTEAENDTEKN
jgi:glycosyltransferase involved in cell wall biosynthesis